MTKSENGQFEKKDFLILGIIILLGLVLRLYKINSPLADWHSWRQVDTASVARIFEREGFDLLHPRYHDLSNVQTGQYNPQGLRLVEFPLYNASFAFLHKTLPILPLEVYGRLISIFFSLLTIIVIYYLLLKEDDRVGAAAGALIFATFPFFVFYSRVVLPDIMATSLIFVSILFMYFLTYSRSKNINILLFLYFAALTTGALAILVKPTVIFYLLVHMYLFFKKYNLSMLKKFQFYFFFLLLIAPFVLWRYWIAKNPVGVPSSEWLLFSVNTSAGQERIFFRPAFFRWVFMERIGILISGIYLTIFLLTGAIKKHKSHLFYIVGIASFLYLFTFQGGNVQHDYYQILILPTIAIYCGLGINFFVENKKIGGNYYLTLSLVAIAIISSFSFSYFRVKDFYVYNPETVEIAKIINTITEPDSIIVTDNVGDTTLLYLSDRKGYPAVTEDLKLLKDRGAQYFVTGRSDVADQNKKIFQLVFESDKVFIFKL